LLSGSIDETDAVSVSDLKAQVKSLERQLKRQKMARENAESFLQTYSKDAYLANQALRKSLQDSKRRERELLFLNRSASQLTAAEDGINFIFSALESVVEFSDALFGKALIVKGGQIIKGDDDSVLSPGDGWLEKPLFTMLLKEELPLTLEESYMHWCVNAISRPDNQAEARLLHFMQDLGNGEFGWLALFTKDDTLEEEMLYVLDTTKHYLKFGIGYQSKTQELSHKKQALSSIKKDHENLQQKLVSADKMAMLGQLAAGIAHEINNPIGYVRSNTAVAKDIFKDYLSALGEIKGLCERQGGQLFDEFCALENSYSLTESAEAISEMFEESSEGIERIIDIVKALRSFSYPGTEKKETVIVNDVINTALRLTSNLYKYKNNVVFNESSEPINVIGSAGQIQQVLVNLITNAVYATPEGKSIYIDVEKSQFQARIIIKDEGVGMSQDVVEKMFTPFFTTKPPGDGTGLGMSISLTIIEEHGGEFDIESKEGVGTTIGITLPLA